MPWNFNANPCLVFRRGFEIFTYFLPCNFNCILYLAIFSGESEMDEPMVVEIVDDNERQESERGKKYIIYFCLSLSIPYQLEHNFTNFDIDKTCLGIFYSFFFRWK